MTKTKTKETKDVQITFRLTSGELERLQRLADMGGITRHQFIHNLVITGVETMEQLESIGILKAVLLARSAEDFVKNAAASIGTATELKA